MCFLLRIVGYIKKNKKMAKEIVQTQIFKNNKEFTAAREEAAKKKKPAKTRGEIMARFHDVLSLAAKRPIVSDKLTGNYAAIYTTEIVINLCTIFGYKVYRESEQIVRRHWKKYQSDATYKAMIDTKQSMAKHCVMLRREDADHNDIARDIIIMNDYKGSMAFKCYIGNFGDMASLYNVSFHHMLPFISAKHTRDNAKTVEDTIFAALESCGVAVVGKYAGKKIHNRNAAASRLHISERTHAIHQKKSTTALVSWTKSFLSHYEKKYKVSKRTYDILLERATTANSYNDVYTLLLRYLVNEQADWFKHATIGVLDTRARKASYICNQPVSVAGEGHTE
jgi:hypothetical protein